MRPELFSPEIIGRKYAPKLFEPESSVWGLRFDGDGAADDGVDLFSGGILSDFNDSLGTIIAWVIPRAVGSMGWVVNGFTTNSNRLYLTHRVNGSFACTRGDPAVTIALSGIVPVDREYCLAMTWSATNFSGYFDGELSASSAWTNTGGAYTRLAIGSRVDQAPITILQVFAGTVIQSVFFNRIFPADEIRHCYKYKNNILSECSRDLIGFYRFQHTRTNTDFTEIRDWSGKENVGRMYGFSGNAAPWENVGVR
jgi:hypothetical protein